MEALTISAQSLRVWLDHSSGVGEVRRRVSDVLPPSAEAKARDQVQVVASELARNVVAHAHRGEFVATVFRSSDSWCVDLMVADQPREVDVTPTPSLGIGLDVIERNSTSFEYRTTAGAGRVARARIGPLAAALPWEVGCIVLPKHGEPRSGDQVRIRLTEREARILVLDGLGHGLMAAESAERGAAAVEAGWDRSLDSLKADVRVLHEALRGMRGCAGHILRLERGASTVQSVSIGNVSAAHIDSKRTYRRMPNGYGVLGRGTLRVQERTIESNAPVSILVHSDGISERAVDDLNRVAPLPPSLHPGFLHAVGRRLADDCAIVSVSEARS